MAVRRIARAGLVVLVAPPTPHHNATLEEVHVMAMRQRTSRPAGRQPEAPTMKLPRCPMGRPSKETAARYEEEVRAWCAELLEVHSGLDFAPGVRGWCYILE